MAMDTVIMDRMHSCAFESQHFHCCRDIRHSEERAHKESRSAAVSQALRSLLENAVMQRLAHAELVNHLKYLFRILNI